MSHRPCVSSSEHFLNIFETFLETVFEHAKVPTYLYRGVFLSQLHVELQRECAFARIPTSQVYLDTYAKGSDINQNKYL